MVGLLSLLLLLLKRMVRGRKEEAIISRKGRIEKKNKKGHSFRVQDHEKCNKQALIMVIVIVKGGCVGFVNVGVDVIDGCVICRESVGRHGQ